MLNLLLKLLKNSQGSSKAIQQVANKLQEKSSFLNLVRTQQQVFRLPKKVDYLFNKELRQRSLSRALRKPGFREQWKRLTKRSTLRRAFKTLSWDYIKKQLWFAKNQGDLLGLSISASKIVQPVADARKIEQSILRRLTLTNKKQVTDSSPLNSSWLYYGVWTASTAQEDYWTGTLRYTVKREYKDGRIVIGKTYVQYNFSLTRWALMKAALGRDGTGAGTVYHQTKGWLSGKEVRASRWSEQVLVKGR